MLLYKTCPRKMVPILLAPLPCWLAWVPHIWSTEKRGFTPTKLAWSETGTIQFWKKNFKGKHKRNDEAKKGIFHFIEMVCSNSAVNLIVEVQIEKVMGDLIILQNEVPFKRLNLDALVLSNLLNATSVASLFHERKICFLFPRGNYLLPIYCFPYKVAKGYLFEHRPKYVRL